MRWAEFWLLVVVSAVVLAASTAFANGTDRKTCCDVDSLNCITVTINETTVINPTPGQDAASCTCEAVAVGESVAKTRIDNCGCDGTFCGSSEAAGTTAPPVTCLRSPTGNTVQVEEWAFAKDLNGNNIVECHDSKTFPFP